MSEAPVKRQRKTRHITDEMLLAAVVLVGNGFSIMRTAALLHVGRSSLSRRLKQRAEHARRGTAAKKRSKKATTAAETTAATETPSAPPSSVVTEAIVDPTPPVIAPANAAL